MCGAAEVPAAQEAPKPVKLEELTEWKGGPHFPPPEYLRTKNQNVTEKMLGRQTIGRIPPGCAGITNHVSGEYPARRGRSS